MSPGARGPLSDAGGRGGARCPASEAEADDAEADKDEDDEDDEDVKDAEDNKDDGDSPGRAVARSDVTGRRLAPRTATCRLKPTNNMMRVCLVPN